MTTTQTTLNDELEFDQFDEIDEHVNAAGLVGLLDQPAPEMAVSRTAQLLASYAAVRPILSAVAVLSIIPQQWRLAVRIFIGALDELTSAGTGIAPERDFKAGKDL